MPPVAYFQSLSFWLSLGAIITLAAWWVREQMLIRRQLELRLAVQQRTEQFEQGQEIEAGRNRILEMLVSNEPLSAVLDSIARAAREQVPEALCIILVKQARASSKDCGFFVGAAPVVPPTWLAALSQEKAIPFEVWKQKCDYPDIASQASWNYFLSLLDTAIPATIRSVPIGESASSHGAMLLLYPETAAADPWERSLRVSARLAHIAIEHRRFCDQLDHQAHHDSLTGLPNRALLNERLENAVMEARTRSHRLGFLYIDVDEFKQINDKFSHRTGDALLVELGNRIRAALRPDDTMARIGGDEFNIILPDIPDASVAMAVASRLLEIARQTISVDGYDLKVTLSIGLSMFPDDGREATDLQRQADAAMYYAKSMGKNRAQAFSDNSRTLDSVRIEQNLRHALQEGWFGLLYQPKFTAAGELAGLEALIRLNHPQHGQILPSQFIPIAESSELIVPIGAWVIAEVCRQIADWRARKLAPVVVAVNVSAVQISRVDFAKTVEACLQVHSIPPCCLELEVTESMVVDPDSEQHRQMQLLRALGVSVSIDDFGTGFSSLSYLHRLKIDAVKLDRSFVQAIATDRGAQHLVRAMIGVARGLGVDVIAEGVETEAQRRELVAAGCPVMQGYLFARPGSAESVEPFLGGDPLDVSEIPDLSRLCSVLG